MLTKPHRQEALCRAYVQAVAARAGLGFMVPEPDYGTDLWLYAVKQRGQRSVDTGPYLGLQLKSTTRAQVEKTHVAYDLEVKTYDDLRDPDAHQQRLLVLLVLPDQEENWLGQSEEALIVRHCAYWQSLCGAKPTTAKKTIRIRLPRTHVFSVPALHALMERLRKGEQL